MSAGLKGRALVESLGKWLGSPLGSTKAPVWEFQRDSRSESMLDMLTAHVKGFEMGDQSAETLECSSEVMLALRWDMPTALLRASELES